MAKRDLAGKVAWITGGVTGIGQGAAEKLAEAGCHVILSGRRAEPLEASAAALRDAGGSAEVLQLDVADADAVDAAAQAISTKYGRLDILMNSAGINTANRRFANFSTKDWKAVVDVNLSGVFYSIQAALPMLRATGDGLVINISSWAGNHINYLTGPGYTATKYGVGAMWEVLNMEEFQHGVRATSVYPAEVATPILDSRPVPVTDADKTRMAQPEDLGDVVLFLAELPGRVCINEITVSPTYNRLYIGQGGSMAPDAE